MNLQHLIIFGLLAVIISQCSSLRCRTDDGPSEEEVKKIVHTCMKKISGNNDSSNNRYGYKNRNSNDRYGNGNDDDDDDDDDSYSNEDNNNDRYENNNNNNNGYDRYNNNNNNYRYQQGSPRYRRTADINKLHAQENGNEWQQYPDQSFTNNNNSSGRQSTGVVDKSCIVQCFFQEMKLTGSDGIPDRHKVLHVMTKNIKDRELKEFYVDSIEQCYHMLEMEQRYEKCSFAKNLVTCLAERAKANCEDFNNETIIF